jgi:xylulokinase
LWWKNTSKAISKIISKHLNITIKAIGISYQMHGLVLIDKDGKPLRNSIIWADGRTKKIGA